MIQRMANVLIAIDDLDFLRGSEDIGIGLSEELD